MLTAQETQSIKKNLKVVIAKLSQKKDYPERILFCYLFKLLVLIEKQDIEIKNLKNAGKGQIKQERG